MAENYFGITDTGKVRINNEDTFIAEPLTKRKLIVASVIDGVGGYSGGEVASGLARQAILEHLKNDATDYLKLVKDAFISANNVVFKERHLSNKNSEMACVATLALVDIENNKFYYAHVGDTRLYLYRDNTLVKISHDHSFVGFLEDSGRLNEAEAMNHAKRNEINKALGFGNSIIEGDYIELGESPFLPNDVLLLCSDGLSDMIDREAMISILKSKEPLNKKGALLIDAANEAGGKDNITAVLVKNDKTVAKHTATKPAAVAEKATRAESKEAITTIYKSPETALPVVEKKRSNAVPVLTFLLVLLLGAFIWLFVQYYQNKNKSGSMPHAVVDTGMKKSDREIQLLESIKSGKNNEAFIVNAATEPPIIISDSISLNQDTLYIKGNGVTLQSNPNFKGVLFNISPQAKYILLDSMTIENFDVGLLVSNNSLHFNKVVFKNCRVPVQYNFMYADNSQVNGPLIDTNQHKLDSLPKLILR